jgi:hypothetical protein
LDATPTARASLACPQAPDCTVVRGPRLAVELPAAGHCAKTIVFQRRLAWLTSEEILSGVCRFSVHHW